MVSKTKTATHSSSSFPSQLESTVASALLLLSSTCCPPNSSESYDDSKITVSQTSSESSVDDQSSLSSAAAAASEIAQLLKLKVVRKKRSKGICISDGGKLTSIKKELAPMPVPTDSASEITMAEASSCLSSGSSADSTGQSRNSVIKGTDKLMKPVRYSQMGHRAEAILRVLSNGSSSEVRIRELLGDSPSTSKALRMLLKLEEVKRRGAGGRGDPYIYMIA